MIKLRYRLFPELFIKKILNIIKKSKDRETAKVNLKQKLKLEDAEIEFILSYKLKYLIEQNMKNEHEMFINRLCEIQYLSKNINYDVAIKLLNEHNIPFNKYEISDYDYFRKKGSPIKCPSTELIILEITNPNHHKHLEIQVDKQMNCVVDLYFDSYWFEYYGCTTEQEFIDIYIETIKKVMNNEMTIVTYYSNNKWIGDRCFYKDANPELDDTEEMNEYFSKLNKKRINKKIVIEKYSWNEYKKIN